MSLDKSRAAEKQKVGILLDIGNSETRVRIKYRPTKGSSQDFDPVELTFALSNHFFGLESSYNITQDYMNRATTILDIGGVRIAHGELVEREMVSSFEFPTGKNDKSSEPITLWTLQLVFLEVLYRLSEQWGIPINDIDVAFNVFCLVPPEEHEHNRDAMANLIAGIDTVTELVPTPDFMGYVPEEHEIICNDIQIFPEGISAFHGIRVNVEGYKLIPNRDVQQYIRGYDLVIDIGAGTTDLAIMQDGVLLADSRCTINDAGNHIIAAVHRKAKANPDVRKKLMMGVHNHKSIMEEAMINEGEGLVVVDCAAALNSAKDELAAVLANRIQDWANSVITISMIRGILVVGGANVAAYRNGECVSPPIANALIEKIRQFAPSAELIPIKNRDPRYLNLDGLEALYVTSLSQKR